MVDIATIETQRLLMRQWNESDLKPFAEMNSDKEVMEYFPGVLTEKESNELATRIIHLINKRGWGLWAIELKKQNIFIGFVGLHKPEIELPFAPCTEIGWRLSKHHWGHGDATEAAKASLKFGFQTLRLDEIVSFTSIVNKRSQSVMKKLNMVNTGSNFQHPSIPSGSHLKEHVLFKINKKQWRETI